MDHHDRWTGSVARPEIDDVEPGAGDLDHLALRGVCALQGKDPGLRYQRQDRQRRHDDSDIICNVRMALGTKQLRFYRGAVSRPNEGFPAVLRASSHKHHREIYII